MNPHLLLRGGTVLDPVAGTSRRADVLIRDGRIAEVAASVQVDDEEVLVVEAQGRYLSPGWFDLHVHLGEPGYEHRETILTGCAAAAVGGFTGVACLPTTDPPLHARDVAAYVIERAEGTGVDVHPIAAVTRDRAGKELTEMADLVEGGAVAFSDATRPVASAGLLRRALEYSAMLDRAILDLPEEPTLNADGHMHEGTVGTRLGVPGIPAVAEEIAVGRDIQLAAFTGGHVHLAPISTARSADLVRHAKANGVRVTASVFVAHLLLDDRAVETSAFDTHTKLHPPLRPAADVAALRDAVRDGTVDVVSSGHTPFASYETEVEYIYAPFGTIGLESAWGVLGLALDAEDPDDLLTRVRALTAAPREILRLPIPTIAPGEPANLTVFDTTTRWTFEPRHVRSLSHNTPFLGRELVGRPWGIYNQGRWMPVEDA